MKKILDVSKYQQNINYAESAKNIDGVIIRCGFTGWGTANECNEDPVFEKHYAGFKEVGVPVGVYYYTAADTIEKALEEAEFCKKLLNDKQLELPVYIDVEEPNRLANLSKEQLTKQVDAWCESMESAGYFVGVYANTDYFTRKLDHSYLSSKYTIWLADYRAAYNTTLKRDMHQHTSAAKVPGINGGVDMSSCTRDFEAEIKIAGLNGWSNQDVSKPDAPSGGDSGASSAKTYVVQQGDSWWAISEKVLGTGVRMNILASVNGKTTYDVIHPGDVLVIPDQETSNEKYVVESGDSWWSIAAKKLGDGARMEQLARFNGKTLEDVIHPGDIILIPG